MAAFKLPRLKANLAIVNGQGKPLDYFLRFWNIEVAPRIEKQEAAQTSQLEAISQLQIQQQQQLDLIYQALELAGGNAGGTSGSDTEFFSLTGSSWTPSALVVLTGVVADNLRITGTGPSTQYGTSAMTGGTVAYGEYRIIEVVSGVDGDTVFNGTFYVTDQTTDEPDQILFVTHSSQSAVAAFNDPRTTTGDVDYRVETRRVSGASVTGMRFYLFVMRS